MSDQPRRRLSSWKEISGYLHRDVRTMARWEKERRLPVHRVPGGRGHSVFAFTDEIDEWLAGGGVEPDPNPPPRTTRGVRLALGVAVATTVALAAPRLWSGGASIQSLEIRGGALAALTPGGEEAWRYSFGKPVRPLPLHEHRAAVEDLDGDGRLEAVAVISAISTSAPALDDDTLQLFDDAGRRRWERRLDDVVRFGGATYLPPWSTGPVVTSQAGGGRILWLTHHHTWWPSIVTMLDAEGAVRGRFVHAGWITAAQIAPDGTVVLAGYSNQHEADVVAVLDDGSWPGAGPPDSGGRYRCDDCPPGRPLRYFILPRSELSAMTNSARMPAHIHRFADSTEVRIVQSTTGAEAGELIVELSGAGAIRAVRASDDYWRWHARLEAEGRVGHPADDCRERRGFRVRQWDRAGGWSEVIAPH